MTMFGSFSNQGFVKDQLSNELYTLLKEEVLSVDLTNDNNLYNSNLAGNISKQFRLSKNRDQLENYVLSLCKEYSNAWDITNTTKDLRTDNLEMYVYWANFQNKHEFNPMHSHDGSYSFVIWIQVPYLIADELSTPQCKNSNMPRAGMFSFIYNNIFGEVREASFPVDKTFEGTIFLFPSAINHIVYPFSTSNDYRISISGNIRRKV